jgi:hypothetical protein
MHTSRSTVGRVLDPADESVTLSTLSCAAAALGRKVDLGERKCPKPHVLEDVERDPVPL